MDQLRQSLELQKRPHVVVATPGRLAEMISYSEDIRKIFNRTAVLVVDEADRVLEPTFEAALTTIMQVRNGVNLRHDPQMSNAFDATLKQCLMSSPTVSSVYAYCVCAVFSLRIRTIRTQDAIAEPMQIIILKC
jgi:superfamily II DNA/RNA helicase